MSTDFYRYVRGVSDQVPEGYSERGMRAYRHLVFVGASQMVQAHFPEVRSQLGDADWQVLIAAFVRQSHWSSPYYGDLKDEFIAFLARENGRPD